VDDGVDARHRPLDRPLVPDVALDRGDPVADIRALLDVEAVFRAGVRVR